MKKSRGEDSLIALVGNKADLEDERKVSTDDGMTKGKEHKVLFVETSAKEDTGINELFQNSIENLIVDDEDSDGEYDDGDNGGANPPNGG